MRWTSRFRGKLGRWFSGQAQYTLSRALNNTPAVNFFPEDQYNPQAEWGIAGYDRLQKLDLIGTIYPDHWLSLGVASALYSGTPYTETAGSDFYHTGLGNARPAGVTRNTLRGGGVATLDLSWSHDLRLTDAKGDKAKVLTPQISAFNILNHTNYTGYIGNITSPLFLRPTGARAARQMQFQLGYRF